jgi:hypothetical protein
MAVKLLTAEQHRRVVEQLITRARQFERTRDHASGPEYTSLMICFLLHNVGAAEALLKLNNSFGNEWFPATVGYTIVRCMFEVDVTAHYISVEPEKRSTQYIKFGHVLDKRRLDACSKHRQSANASWRDGMELIWQSDLSAKAADINRKYETVRGLFEATTERRKKRQFPNWSGKSLRQMAIDVNHTEAYDVFYADLSSFAHADVRLADRFLRIRDGNLNWSARARDGDVGNVFRYAATFLTCFLELFGQQFSLWSKSEIDECWNVARGREERDITDIDVVGNQ